MGFRRGADRDSSHLSRDAVGVTPPPPLLLQRPVKKRAFRRLRSDDDGDVVSTTRLDESRALPYKASSWA